MSTQRIDSPARLWSHYGGLVILAIICLTPIWVMISTSFKNEVLIFDAKPVWFFFFPTMDNYDYILTRGKFDRYFINSVIVATISTFLTLFLGGLCAYALARLEFKGRRFVANATLLVRMVPPAVLAVPAFAMVATLSLNADLTVLIFFYTALNLPFAIWLLFGFLQADPGGIGGSGHCRRRLAAAGLLQGSVPYDEVGLCRRGHLHFPHRLERIHPRPPTDRAENQNASGRRGWLHHRYRSGVGAHHGHGHAHRNPTAAFYLLCCAPDHQRTHRRFGQGLRELSDAQQ